MEERREQRGESHFKPKERQPRALRYYVMLGHLWLSAYQRVVIGRNLRRPVASSEAGSPPCPARLLFFYF